jgi:hypothetical protein
MPRSKGRGNRRTGHSTRGSRRSGGPTRPADASSALARTIFREARDLTASPLADALQAEIFASQLLGIGYVGANLDTGPGSPEPEPHEHERIFDLVRSGALRRRTPEALVLMRAMAATASPELAARAADAADLLERDRGVEAPPWVAQIGAAEPVEAWRVTHALGDQEVVLAVFRYPDRDPHLVSVLIDHNLGGIAKSIGVSDVPDEVIGTWRDDPAFDVAPIDGAEAAGRIRVAIEQTDMTVGPPVEDDFGSGAISRSLASVSGPRHGSRCHVPSAPRRNGTRSWWSSSARRSARRSMTIPSSGSPSSRSTTCATTEQAIRSGGTPSPSSCSWPTGCLGRRS